MADKVIDELVERGLVYIADNEAWTAHLATGTKRYGICGAFDPVMTSDSFNLTVRLLVQAVTRENVTHFRVTETPDALDDNGMPLTAEGGIMVHVEAC